MLNHDDRFVTVTNLVYTSASLAQTGILVFDECHRDSVVMKSFM